MDAGFDVIYTACARRLSSCRDRQHGDVDVIGLSSMAGSHLDYCRRLKTELDDRQLADKLWIIGGNIPADDEGELMSLGLDGVFPVGSQLDDIVNFINEKLQ